MVEIFKPRANMQRIHSIFFSHDEKGNLICDGGPSIIGDDGKTWKFYISGIGLHRLDGPATSDGQWCFHGKNVTKEIHDFAEENSIDLENLTDEDKIIISLKFG